jgi:8-oxo-dGTP pyrophosphatase MutT (NUDIX family)
MAPWKVLGKKYILKTPWLNVRQDHVLLPNGTELDDFYVLEYCHWVCIIAETVDGKFLIEKQYRYGIDKECYELCAGIVENDEEPLVAAKRELLEETGYASDRWTYLGKSAPNASAMTNYCYCFVAKNAKKVDTQHLDNSEDIIVLEVSKEELFELMKTEAIVEADMLAGLWKYFTIYN